MIKHRPEPNFFDLWIDLNDQLWNGFTAFCAFPQTVDALNSVCFGPVSAWNRWIDQCLHFQVDSVLPSVEQALLHTPLPVEVSAEAILEAIQNQSESSLPHHHEFDTLIYPWNEAERPMQPDITKVA